MDFTKTQFTQLFTMKNHKIFVFDEFLSVSIAPAAFTYKKILSFLNVKMLDIDLRTNPLPSDYCPIPFLPSRCVRNTIRVNMLGHFN